MIQHFITRTFHVINKNAALALTEQKRSVRRREKHSHIESWVEIYVATCFHRRFISDDSLLSEGWSDDVNETKITTKLPWVGWKLLSASAYMLRALMSLVARRRHFKIDITLTNTFHMITSWKTTELYWETFLLHHEAKIREIFSEKFPVIIHSQAKKFTWSWTWRLHDCQAFSISLKNVQTSRFFY